MACEFGGEPHAFCRLLHLGRDISEEVEGTRRGDFEKAWEMRARRFAQVKTQGTRICEDVPHVERVFVFRYIDLHFQCVRAPGSRGQGFRCDADSDSDLARTRFRGTRTSFREAGSGC